VNPLTVAVTGPTGTFGHGLLPLLEADPRIGRVVGIARSPFDPAAQGWAKLEYRRGDVRDRAALEEAFAGADAVVHLAFIVVGGSKETTRTINVEGTLNAFRAAAAAGVRRFVYASSVAAYGFHPDNPGLIREDWPTRPAARLRYAQEKAELEALLLAEHAQHPALELYLLRPPVVVGPHTVGGKAVLPGPLAPLNRYLEGGLRRVPVPLPALLPDLPLQLVHEDDVGRALLQCVLGAGPPGAYNIAGDGVLSALDVARELGLVPNPLPPRPVQAVARLVARWGVVPQTGWAEVIDRPPLMDTTKAKELLGWRPAFTGLEALRATLDR
jgi:nucleoside-diphosphate-sugar epimerase